MSGNRLKLDMKQNAVHSIRRAIDSLNQHAQSNDAFLMKDAVLFFHHGIELLMKEMLRKHSEYLIFEDIKELHTKVNRAKKEQVDIFFWIHLRRRSVLTWHYNALLRFSTQWNSRAILKILLPN